MRKTANKLRNMNPNMLGRVQSIVKYQGLMISKGISRVRGPDLSPEEYHEFPSINSMQI
jgi:hypothetical protein